MARKRKNKTNESLIQKHGVMSGFAGAAIAGIVALVIALTNKPAPAGDQINHSGSGDAQIGDTINNSITIGYTIEQHQQRLQTEKAALSANLAKIHSGEMQVKALEQQLLESKIATIENQLIHFKDSYDKRIRFLESTIKALREEAGDTDKTLLAAAEAQLRQGDSAKADQLFKQIEDKAQATIKRAAKAAFERGKIAQENLDYYAAYDHFERAVGYAADNPLYLSYAALMAGTLAKHQQQIVWNEKALGIVLQQQGEDLLVVPILSNNLGSAYKSLGQYQKAIGYYKQALAADLKIYGESHLDVAIDRNNLGSAYKALGQYQKAIGYFQQALTSDLNTYGESHPAVARVRNNLGLAYNSLDQHKKAIGYYQQALASDLKTYEEGHPYVAIYRNHLGSAYNSLGQYEKAIGYFQQALAADLKTYGESHPDVAIVHNNLASAYYSLGQYQKAVDFQQQALAIYEKIFDSAHPDVKMMRDSLKFYKAKIAQGGNDGGG
ncbi:MAG: tetratricopeptide (TPR) repeat protein [Phenylobacterium sp.]|jgi:tetratricopeptide (TPR) repeat protein